MPPLPSSPNPLPFPRLDSSGLFHCCQLVRRALSQRARRVLRPLAPSPTFPSRPSLPRVELKPPVLKPPSLSQLYGHAQLPVIIDDLAKVLPDPNNPLAGMTGMLTEKDISHDAVMAAFSRLDSEIRGWGTYAEETGYGLEPVDEGQEEDHEDYTDNTFLTGIGMPVDGLREGNDEVRKIPDFGFEFCCLRGFLY